MIAALALFLLAGCTSESAPTAQYAARLDMNHGLPVANGTPATIVLDLAFCDGRLASAPMSPGAVVFIPTDVCSLTVLAGPSTEDPDAK